MVELLGDAARLLNDVQFQESQSRRNILGVYLKKDVLSSVANSKPLDGWLFGDNLSERLKSAAALEKSGKELKAAAASRPSSSKKSKPLNYQGPFSHRNRKPPVTSHRLGGRQYSHSHQPRRKEGPARPRHSAPKYRDRKF